MTLAEIKNLLSLFFFNKEAGRMMNENEIKANYLDIYTDIFKLLENFEKVKMPTNEVVGKFFGTVLVAGMTLSDITAFMARQITLNIIVDKFFGKIPLTGPTLAEIKSAIDEQKLTSEIINKFFEGSKPQEITTNFSTIDQYIKDQEQLGIRDLLVSFFLDTDNRMIGHTEIKANYLYIYTDIFKLKRF